jgi:hypothetical protein
MFERHVDSQGQTYAIVGNLRLTIVTKTGWAGPEVTRYLRIQSYKGIPGQSKLFRGAEFPLRGAEWQELITVILGLALG